MQIGELLKIVTLKLTELLNSMTPNKYIFCSSFLTIVCIFTEQNIDVSNKRWIIINLKFWLLVIRKIKELCGPGNFASKKIQKVLNSSFSTFLIQIGELFNIVILTSTELLSSMSPNEYILHSLFDNSVLSLFLSTRLTLVPKHKSREIWNSGCLWSRKSMKFVLLIIFHR